VTAATFLYLDYGPSPLIGRELRYCLATLRAEIPQARVVVYTDKPLAYSALGLTVRALGEDLARWSRAGAIAHRLKPCVLADALSAYGGLCVLLDTDSYIRPGFAAALAQATRDGPAMDHHECDDPFPALKGGSVWLPQGQYIYERSSAMYNSGLIAAQAERDSAAVAEAVALIDALWEQGQRDFRLEQFAISEAFRRQGRPIGEMRPSFQHYYRRSLKRYMHWRIAAWLKRTGGAPTRPCILHSRNAVRVFNIVARVARLWRSQASSPDSLSR